MGTPPSRGEASGASTTSPPSRGEASSDYANAPVVYEDENDLLLDLRAQAGCEKATIHQMGAARDFLEDGEIAWSELAARHGIVQSPGCWETVIKIARRVGWVQPPAVALHTDEPTNVAIVSNLQLLLQVATAGGGSSSRSETGFATVAIATELMRDPRLNVSAACVRHGVTIGHLGSGRKSARERVERTLAVLVELNLTDWRALQRDWSVKLDKTSVKALQARCRVCVAEAARALHAAGCDFEAAHSALLAGRPELVRAAETVAPTAAAVFDDPQLLRIQAALKAEAMSRAAAEAGMAEGAAGLHARRGTGALVGLKTIAVAVEMAKARAAAGTDGEPADEAPPSFDLHECAIRHGISDPNEAAGRNRKGLHDRVWPVGERILQLGLLEPAALEGAEGAEGTAAAAAPPPFPTEDAAWMDELQRRVITDTSWRTTTDKWPAQTLLRAALELCRHVVPDIGAACERCGISLEKCGASTSTTLRQMRDKIRVLGLLDVPPEELMVPPPKDDAARAMLLASLRLRLTQRSSQTAPDATNLAVAYDVHTLGLPLRVAAVRRRHELSGSRVKAIEKLATQLAELEKLQPLDALLHAGDIEELRAMANRSGLNVPSFRSTAFALVAEGAAGAAAAAASSSSSAAAADGVDGADGAAAAAPGSSAATSSSSAAASAPADAPEAPPPVAGLLPPELLLRACNRLRAEAGQPPVEASFFTHGVDESEPAPAFEPRVRPPPISDGMLTELQRRLQKKRKLNSIAKLPAPVMIRAAVDCCRDDVMHLRWDQINFDEVVSWHFPAEAGAKKANNHSRIQTIRTLRDEIRCFGKLEFLDPATARKVRHEKDGVSGVLAQNLQLLLQTGTSNGGSSSRSAIALKTIVVALELIRDADFDLLEACTTHAIGGLGKGSGTEKSFGERMRSVRDQILENKLLELPKVETRLISREQVDALRAQQPYLPVARAAEAVLKYGKRLDLAMAELRAELEGEEGAEELLTEAEGVTLHLSKCDRSARGATGYTGVTRQVSGKLYEARSQEHGTAVKLGTFSRAVDAALAYARYRRRAHLTWWLGVASSCGLGHVAGTDSSGRRSALRRRRRKRRGRGGARRARRRRWRWPAISSTTIWRGRQPTRRRRRRRRRRRPSARARALRRRRPPRSVGLGARSPRWWPRRSPLQLGSPRGSPRAFSTPLAMG